MSLPISKTKLIASINKIFEMAGHGNSYNSKQQSVAEWLLEQYQGPDLKQLVEKLACNSDKEL